MINTILNIDDDSTDNVVFKKLTEKLKVDSKNVQIHSDPHKAIELLRASLTDFTLEIPEVIFVDLQMPLLNGFEVLDIIKELGIMEKSDVYLVSCNFDKRDMDKLQDYPSLAGCVQKPFTLSKMKGLLGCQVAA